jgi:hypothetical protein
MAKKVSKDIDVNSPEFKLKAEHFLDILPDAMALRNWIKAYLDIDLPFDTIDPDSNSNPIDALWSVYDCIKNNKGDEIPGFIYLSAREAYKTLGASILEVILLLHFKTSIAHMAAIDKQSQKAISYINNFFRKLKPYLDYHGWKKISDSKTKIQFVEPGGAEPYITVIICTAQGANCISGDSILELENGKTIRAAEVTKGLKIKTWDYRNQKDIYVTSKGISLVKKHARKLIMSNGSEIILSDDHLIFTQNGWVFADSVKIGDRVKTSDIISKSFVIKQDHYENRSPLSRVGKGLTVDSGEWFYSSRDKKGFSYSKTPNRSEKKLFRQVRNALNAEVVKIELLGLQELVDLHIDHEDPILRSFYANGIFVHNSEHVPIMFIDEVDVVRDPSAYEEAKLIPGMDRGIYPITVKLSTRKYAFGLMQAELDLAKKTGEQIKRWNILDITERCPPERHLPDEPKQEVYVAKNLPFRTISEEQYQNEADKNKWEKITAFKGCLSCDLLPVCKTRLAKKPEKAKKGLYRPIKATINSFKRVSPEMGEAQLLCWKPSTKGLVYGRFEPNEGGNTISVLNAAKMIAGDHITSCTMEMFVELLKDHGYTFYAGLDWGFTHESAFVIFAKGALGPSFIVDCFAESGLELADFVEKCVEYQKKYPISRWFCDQAQPSHIKTLSKALKAVSPSTQCPEFTKDVMGGIEAIRSQIVTTSGVRKLLILNTEANQKLIQGFKVHHFKLDARGNPTTTPDDEEYADLMDCVRYVGQNIYNTKKGHKTFVAAADEIHPATPNDVAKKVEEINKNIMLEKINELTGGTGRGKIGGKKGKIVWSI